MIRWLVVVAVAVAWSAGVAEASAGAPPVRRLALVAGANDGGPLRERLRYAVSDAERTAQVLQRLGGVAPEDAVVLLDPGEPGLRAALDELRRRVAALRAAPRVEVIFYYSGHADEEGLLLRGARLPYQDLRRWLEQVGADVRVAVIDSCASGALTRGKGGRVISPFLVDTSQRVSGQAILTSSAWDEASQESDRIAASFFTAALLTGLRGAADANRDGRVTLSEAYQFAFQETLARTERSRGGPQHPSWDIQLAGAGDVVLTDLRGSDASLLLPEEASGRFFVRDASERLIAELRKEPGQPVVLGLDPGRYRVARDGPDGLVEVKVEVKAGPSTPLPAAGFSPVPRELTARRGGEPSPLERRFLDLAVFPPASLNGDRPAANNLQLALIGSRTTRLRGVGLGPVVWADEDVVGAYVAYIGSSAHGTLTGAQLAGVANVANDLDGLQASSVFNLARGEVRGVQTAAFVNWAGGDVTGLQVGHLNRSRSLAGAQVGLASLAGDVRGLQVGLVNTSAAATGLQLGLVDWASGARGLQLGLVNVSGPLTGLQLGLVNRATRARGFQIGLVNVADSVEGGAPLGLLSFVRDGERKLLVLGDSSGTGAAELLLGTRRFHTLLRVRGQRVSAGSRLWVGYGMGLHWARGPLLLDVDGLAECSPSEERSHALVSVRALVGWQLAPAVAVVAGPTLSGFWAERGFESGLSGAAHRDLGGGGRGWVGLQAGLRLGP